MSRTAARAADIVISEFMDEQAVAGLSSEFAVCYDPGLVDRRSELTRLASASRALIVRNRTRVDAELLSACPALRVVGRLGVGLDNIDMALCQRRGVEVFPATGANTVAVAELVLAGLLQLRRGVFQASAEVAAGDWPRQRLIGRELAGATLALVGCGGIARAVAERARAFAMKVIGCDPHLNPENWPAGIEAEHDLRALLARADALSLHVPLSDQTRGLVDRAALALMKPEAILINTARGGVVDENELARALLAGRLGGAVLDVFEHEPLAAGSPLAEVVARYPQRLILTPHIGGVTEEANVRVSVLTAEQVRGALRRLDGAPAS